ncbi:MAG: hypothetical protein A3A58_00295 [Candidatus Blackburnbacteria bacterium RIFCSPLOWO2_01_FULL_41_27]|uniref:Uncharacterized protein n=2 Tax=Candidatus Blackburniibacteriota TaxID=1817898 RepID=A0A1G1VC06_9BACT|nr:MAG: hypothetical protein A3A58_00295 [Candidatus Blackburnbacteria bacterium RIFCSPLOWO2_01_FULL_41_27]OGY12925.1 MAG: hypothetical protein A3F61_00680 [Candidatus Blackburnbacteria bacterium RIFCSPHIGHO2_12_FULL_41_13b]
MQVLDLSSKPRVKGAKHWFQEINQLYHPTGEFEQDSQDIVYSYDNLNTTKFVPILLKEWFYLVKEGGYLVIDYIPNKRSNFKKLEQQMWWLWKGKYDIVYHGKIEQRAQNKEQIIDFVKNPPDQPDPSKEDGSYFRFVVKKLESTKILGDSVGKWTFGMLTMGDRNEWVEEIFAAIRKQKIPHYEVIVCGKYFDRDEKDFTYIPFGQRLFKPGGWKGWITKQKNLIARNAKYENVCIMHDRIVLDDNWFKGVKKYGNTFELMCVKQTLRGTAIRSGDWITYGSNTLDLPYNIAKLDYKDWDEQIYVGGMLTILKKSIAKECPWSEIRYWGEEDVELTFRQRGHGYLARFNPYSSIEALSWRFGELPSKYYLSQGLLPKDMLLRRFMRQLNKLVFSVPILREATSPLVVMFIKSRLYRFLTSH